jgi:hypothetical protein
MLSASLLPTRSLLCKVRISEASSPLPRRVASSAPLRTTRFSYFCGLIIWSKGEWTQSSAHIFHFLIDLPLRLHCLEWPWWPCLADLFPVTGCSNSCQNTRMCLIVYTSPSYNPSAVLQTGLIMNLVHCLMHCFWGAVSCHTRALMTGNGIQSMSMCRSVYNEALTKPLISIRNLPIYQTMSSDVP